jgi:hypothetical protein
MNEQGLRSGKPENPVMVAVEAEDYELLQKLHSITDKGRSAEVKKKDNRFVVYDVMKKIS